MDLSFVLKGDLCYSEDARTLRTLAGGYLVCVDGRSMGTFLTLPERYQSLPLIDYTGKLIIPGLCDLHMHAPQFSYRALGMDLELLEWLNTHTFPEESRFCDLEYAKSAYEPMVRDVRSGPNTRVCLFATVHVPATLMLMDMMEASGLVSMVGKVNMDRNAPESLRERDAQRSLDDTRAWLSQCEGRYLRTSPILTPRFIPSCTDELMRGLGALQAEFGLPLQTHLSENHDEIEWVRELCPESQNYADAYARIGVMEPGASSIMAHCVWCDERELELLRRRGAYVTHCPQSNTNISSGIAPIRRYLSHGLNMGLGSDVAGGCHTSIFRAMSDAIQVSKLRWRLVDADEAPLSLAEAFYLGTKGGGSFFGKVGSFEQSYELDAVVIDDAPLGTPYALALEDRLARAIYLSDDRNICQKYVRGKALFG